MPYLLGIFVGALVATFLLSRLILFIMKRWGRDYRTVTLANGVSGLVSVISAGFGFADGGAWAGGFAAMIYIPAQCLWMAVDLWRVHRGKQLKTQ